MTALVLLLSSDQEPRAAAEARVRAWLLETETAPRPKRVYHVDLATLIWQTGPAIVRQQAEPDSLVFELDSEGVAGPVGEVPALHGLRVKHRDAGGWSLSRAWLTERTWYWARHRGVWAIATSPRLVLAALNLPVVENDSAVAAFFGLRPLPPPACFFSGVIALAPGQTIELAADGSTFSVIPAQNYHPTPVTEGSDAVWQERFEARLLASVRAAAGTGPAGLMLSGGLDSTALAAALAALDVPARLYSWVLSAEPSADESTCAQATAQALGLPLELVPVDQMPFADLDRQPINPDAPLANPYRAMNDMLMHVAAQQGVQTLLSGNFGDHFYPEPHAAFSSAWRHHRPDLAARHLWTKVHRRLRRGLRRTVTPRMPEALTPFALSLLQAAPEQRLVSLQVEDPSRLPDLFGPAAHIDAEGAWWFAERHGLDMWFPYRHAGMIDLALTMPVHLSERLGVRKWLTRQWLSTRVPAQVWQRPKSGSLAPWFWRGLRQYRDDVAGLLFQPSAKWQTFMNPEVVELALQNGQDEGAGLRLWQAVCYEKWRQATHVGSLRYHSPVNGKI